MLHWQKMAQFKTFFPKECKMQLSCWNNEHILRLCRPEELKELSDICCQRTLPILCRLLKTSTQHTASACGMATIQCSRKWKLPTNRCRAQLPMHGAPPSSYTIQEALHIQIGHFPGSSFRVPSSLSMKNFCKLPCRALVLLQTRTPGSSSSSQWSSDPEHLQAIL